MNSATIIPEACHDIGLKSKSENIKSFLLRLADALRSGEPLAEFLAREAEVQSEDYENKYERDLEGLKQWSNAFSSIIMSVSLIVIIQVITSMIYSMNPTVMGGSGYQRHPDERASAHGLSIVPPRAKS